MDILETSRGCTHSCIFCSGGSLYPNNYRVHSPEYVFKEIDEYKVIDEPRKYDVVLNYPLENGYPVCCKINVAPLDTFTHSELNTRFQFSTVFKYEEVPEFKPLVIEVIFYHNTQGDYPEGTISTWRGEPFNPPKEEVENVSGE